MTIITSFKVFVAQTDRQDLMQSKYCILFTSFICISLNKLSYLTLSIKLFYITVSINYNHFLFQELFLPVKSNLAYQIQTSTKTVAQHSPERSPCYYKTFEMMEYFSILCLFIAFVPYEFFFTRVETPPATNVDNYGRSSESSLSCPTPSVTRNVCFVSHIRKTHELLFR